MPIAAAIAIRYLIMAAVQLGIWTLLEKYGIPLLNNAVQSIMQAFGVSEQTAKDIMANKVLRAFEEVGIFAITLKTKMPIKVAEYLGFTSKGYAIRQISEVKALAAEKTAISATSKAAATAQEVEEIIKVTAKTSGWQIKGVGDLLKYVTLVVGTPVGFFYAFAQYIDYAAWQNPYQKTFEGLLSYIGIHPDTKLASAGSVSADIWKRIYVTIEQLKPLGISFPFSNRDTPYSRANLANLVDEVAANIVKSGKQPTYKNVIAVVLASLQFNGKEPSVPTFPVTLNSTNIGLSPGQFSGAASTTTKVFTGIVSQGVVGQGLVFTPRPDDMIESADELRQAAANNLAPFLSALLGKIVYEVKVVSSIITKEGFKQSGQTQRIQTGTDTQGRPKYKTVTNKFATLVVYALTDKGSRAKLTTIVLGPTNSAKLTVAQNDLRTLETELPALVTTTDINEITGISTAAPITITTPKAAAVSEGKQPDDPSNKYNTATGKLNPNYNPTSAPSAPTPVQGLALSQEESKTYNANNYVSINPDNISTYQAKGYLIKAIGNTPATQQVRGYAPIGAPVLDTAPVVTPVVTTIAKAGGEALTLSEWYQAQGQQLPSLTTRATAYQAFGLGQSSYYLGTAEQNTKLLAALKAS